VIVLAVLLVLFSANRIAVFVTDLWWFSERGFRDIFLGVFGARVALGVVAGVLLAALVAVNLLIARRLRPFTVPSTPEQAQIQRYREMADPYLPWLILAVAALFGLTSGVAVSAQWESLLLFLNGGEVGIADPQFDTDVGFYLFQLPFLGFLQTWLFTSLILVGLLTAGAHYLLGGIRPEAPEEKVLPSVKTHLAILLAAILAVRAWGYWLDRYGLLYSERGPTTGAAYTDINAELPALYLLLGVSVIAIVLVLAAIRRRGYILPGAAVALLVVASIILQGIYPAAIQRLQVDPQELARERDFIARNLEATRAAYGLDEVDRQRFSVGNDLDEDDVIENEVTLRNVRLWDPDVLETTYSELQALRPYYRFFDVDIDRYEINGELRQVMLATRELSDLPQEADTWQNRHITFTHGFGIVASQVNTANPEGQPVFLSRDIPPTGEDELAPDEEPGVYFGDFRAPIYSLVRTDAEELDFEDPETLDQVMTEYDGTGGVAINSVARRLAFTLRFNDYNLMLTGLLNDESRILFHRNVRDRVGQVAPFLRLDGDPYPVVTEGNEVHWIVDAYTTSNYYPYSEREALDTAGEVTPVNYVRNSVKVAVDAYSGEMTFYRVEDDDPVLDAWQEIFPELITPADEAPEHLERHFRYPQDLFRLQSNLFTRYHIQDADGFYNRANAWQLPADPAFAANQGGGDQLAGGNQRAYEPYYLLMRLPEADTEEFVLIQPYLARERPNMVSWLAGRSDPGHLNDLVSVQFPANQTILGPMQAQARIEQDDDISAYITLRDAQGSSVIRGNMQVLPVADSILYVVPIFLENPEARIPELARVAVVMGEQTVFDRTFAGALGQLLGIEVPDVLLEDEARAAVDEDEIDDAEALEDLDAADPDEEPAEEPDDVEIDEPDEDLTEGQQLLGEALAAFAAAEEALREGDLATYQEQIAIARDLIEEAAEAEGTTVEGLGD
jgi:uncharacterized protein